MLAHVRVRVRMHVCVMCLSARCESGYLCADMHVHVHVHVHVYVHTTRTIATPITCRPQFGTRVTLLTPFTTMHTEKGYIDQTRALFLQISSFKLL